MDDKSTTRQERIKHVAKMNANFRIEGFVPDEEDRLLQTQYIDGIKSLDDLLECAKAYARERSMTPDPRED